MMISKIKYIHENPVKRGYVDEATHWRYSSARDYEGIERWRDFGNLGSCMHPHRGRMGTRKCSQQIFLSL